MIRKSFRMVVPPPCTDFNTTSTPSSVAQHQPNPTSISDMEDPASNASQSKNHENAQRKKLRRFTYLPSYDEVLVKAVRDTDAHKAEHGKKEQAFKSVQDKVMMAIPESVFETYERPSLKSLRDRYMRLEDKRRETACLNEVMSGNVETVTDLDILLDDLIHEKDEWKEQQQAYKGRSSERERKLVEAGEEIRTLAISRNRSLEEDGEVEEVISAEATPKKQRKSTSALEDVSACLVDMAERQRVMDESKLAIDEQRFAFERERAEKKDEQLERTQAIAERRQTLEERRFDLDKAEREEKMKEDREERKEARQERKAMLSLIEKLMQK